jgi:hypothetical protein
MTLVQSWIDSLTLLKPKNAQLFIMVTIKSIIEAYKIMFRYWWWLIGLIVAWYILVACYILPIMLPARTWVGVVLFSIIPFVLNQMLFLAICFVTRPSIMKKDWSYFGTQYRKTIIYCLLLPVAIALIAFSLVPTFAFLCFKNNIFGYLLIVPTLMYLLLSAYFGWGVFLVLFFADSSGGPKNFLFSVWNALKMIIFNLPLLLVVGAFFYGFVGLFFQCMIKVIALTVSDEAIFAQIFWVTQLIRKILGCLLLPISVCTYANIYIKKLHDQFDLYFKQA